MGVIVVKGRSYRRDATTEAHGYEGKTVDEVRAGREP